MKKKSITIVIGLACILACWTFPASAHPYLVGDNWADLQVLGAQAQGILDAIMTEYAGCNLWSTSCNGQTAIWSTIIGQRGPGWTPVSGYTADHAANRNPGWGPEQTFVRADYHWAFLEEALKPGACLDGVPPARVQEIRNAFNNNKNRVLSTEITVYGVRVQASVLGCDNDHTRNVTTGGSISLPISAGSPFCPTVYTVNEGIPSLFGGANGGPILNEAHPQFRDMLANMTAAYMTIGDSRVVDYWYAFMGRIGLTFVSELLPGLLSGIGKENPEKMENPAFVIADAMLQALREIKLDPGKYDKAPCQPWGNVPGINVNIPVSGLPVVGTININVSIGDNNVCLTLRNFADSFNCSNYTCLPDYLALKTSQGDLNADGTVNLTSWFLANTNLQDWKVREGAGGYLDITLQPVAPAAPVNYGSVFPFSVTGVSSVPISYQWYAGYNPAALSPVSGANTRDFSPTVDFYSFNGTTTSKYYRVDLSATYCGSNHVLASQVVKIDGGLPPDIQIFEHPQGGNFYPGETVILSVNAGSLAGPGVTYQWQKYNTGTSTWDNIPGETQVGLTFDQIMPADAGRYRVQIFNQVAPSPLYWEFSDEAELNVAPLIVISPQPLGSEILIGSDYTMTVGATVAQGVLEFRWQRNTGYGFQNLTAWGSQTTWDIVGAQVTDAGVYRCQVRNTLAPFGIYQANSDPAVITISSGTVFRVDKSAPGVTQDGLTWNTAFKTLQPAIDAAAGQSGGGEVWVAGGPIGSPVVYNEARTEFWGGTTGQPGRVQGSLVMKSNVRVYGGFEGWRGGAGKQEEYRQQRVVYQNRAVIDGSTSRGGSAAYHVVVFGRAGVPTTNATLDGLVITGGNAAGVSGDYHTWRGGGIYNWQSTPVIENCYILNNRAAVAGGGIANEGGQWGSAGATLVNCIIQGNQAARLADDYFVANIPPWRGTAPNPLRGGAGIFNNKSNPTMRFLTVRDNTMGAFTPIDANNWGANTGGIFTFAGSELENPAGSGFYNSGNVLLTNSILWGNDGGMQFGRIHLSNDDCTVTYSNIQGGWAGSGSNNSAANPNLDANSIPQAGSPVIDTGDPTVLDGEDIRGVPRPVGAFVDRGAVEYSANGPVPACTPTFLDFIETPQITNIFDVYNAEGTVSEAPIWKIELQNKTFNCNSVPTDSIQVTVTDILGRSASCVADVNVTESFPPTAVVNPKTINLLDNGLYTLTEEDVLSIGELSYDNCYVSWISVVPSFYRCSQAGKNVFVTLLVVDGSGNPSAVSTLLRIRDVTPPVPAGGTIDVALNQFGQYTLSQADINLLASGSTDACGIAWGFTVSDTTSFNCGNIGPNTVTLTVYDNNGNPGAALGTVNVHDVTPPAIYGARNQSFTTFAAEDYTEARALENVTADDFCEGDLTGAITVEAFDADDNPVPFPVPHDYDTGGQFEYAFRLKYSVQDSSGNEAVVEAILNLYDLRLPEIVILGEPHMVVECGDEYVDPGARAYDPLDGRDITYLMETVIGVDNETPGSYTVAYYILLDDYNLLVQEERTVDVFDTLKPVITLAGETVIGIQTGSGYAEPGFSAADHCVGDLTGAVVVTGAVDPNTPGTYVVNYDVTDGLYAADTQTRTVYVGDLIAFTEHPVGGRLYTTDDPITLGARYTNGIFVDSQEWYRDLVGLGTEPPDLGGNTVTLTVDPANHPLGAFQYKLVVYDVIGLHESNPASVEVATPLTVFQDLEDIALGEGAEYGWGISVTGGLGALHYQWYRQDPETKGFVPVADGIYPHPTLGPGAYEGAATSTLLFAPYTETMAGAYQVEVSDDYTSIVVGPATLSHVQGVPAAGALALAALALATALGGSAALRRKR